MSRKINKILKIIFWSLFSLPFLALGTLLLLVASGYYGKLPTFEELESPKSNVATDLIANDGSLLGQYYVENRTFVDYEELSPHLINALVSTEDARYTSHSGIDFISLFRVALRTVIMQDNQGGGSTITQQLAKNLFPRNIQSEDSRNMRMWKTVISKLKEWITAVRLEYNYTKEEIIVMYFNIVEYGNNTYGIKSAAKTYFNKLPSELTIEEASLLVGVVNAITRYNPVRNKENALARRNTVISRLQSNGVISKKERDSIQQIPINLNFRVASHNTGDATYFRSMVGQYMNAKKPERRNFYSEWDYKQELLLWESDPLYGWCNKNKKSDGTNYNIYRDGLKIYATIDPRMQKYAENAVIKHMKDVIQPAFNLQVENNNSIFSEDTDLEAQEKIMWDAIKTTDRYIRLSKEERVKEVAMEHFRKAVKMKVFSYDEPNGRDTMMTPYDSILYHKSILRSSFMAMEPSTGEVKAYVGGNNFKFFKYDMVRQGKRQVGSTIKPFIYTFAIDHLGHEPCTAVPDLSVAVDGWQPSDEGAAYAGTLRPLWWGLAKSRNNFSAWIIKQSNYNAVSDLIYKMGIKSYIAPVPSMCLGPSDISLYEMVGAYGTFVNKGVYTRPIFITQIEDKRGEVLATFSAQTNEAISEHSAATIISMLQKVVTEGTGRRLGWGYEIRGEIGGKTGTTNNGSDGWFIGVTPKLVAGGWVGGENRSIHPEKDSEGARLALPIYAEFLNQVYADKSLNIKRDDKFVTPTGYKFIDCDEIIKEKQQETKRETKSRNFFL